MQILKRNKLIILCVLACLMIVFALCSVTKPNSQSVGTVEKEGATASVPQHQLSRDELVIGVSGAVGTPFLSPTDGDVIACSLIYEPLLHFDANGDILFAIADKLDISEDGITYTISIDKNSVFSNGEPVTPEDVKLSYHMFADSSIDTPYAAALSYISGYTEFRNGLANDINGITTADGTVTFQFLKPSWRNISVFNIPIANASAFEYEQGDARAIITENSLDLLGSGAFVLSDTDSAGIELTRTDSNGFNAVRIRPVGTSSVLTFFNAGTIDMYTFDYNPILLNDIAQIENASLYSYSSSAVPYIGINCRNAPLNDLNIRKALASAAHGNVEDARTLLTQAGYSLYTPDNSDASNILQLTIATYDTESFTEACYAIASAFEQAGIKCEVLPSELGELRELINNESFDLYYTSAEPGKHGSVYFDNNELEGFFDETIETLKNNMELAIDYESYRKLYSDTVKAYEEKIPRIALENRKRYILYSPRISGIDPNPYETAFWGLEQYKRID